MGHRFAQVLRRRSRQNGRNHTGCGWRVGLRGRRGDEPSPTRVCLMFVDTQTPYLRRITAFWAVTIRCAAAAGGCAALMRATTASPASVGNGTWTGIVRTETVRD